MKKFIALCSVAVPLVMAAPASAGHEQSRSLNFEDVLRTFVLSQFDNVEYRSGRHGRDHGRGYARERQVIPIARLVRQIQRETGGRVTSVRLRPNGRVYKIEGIGQRGRFVSAKANAFTGEIFDVRRQPGHEQVATNGRPIPRILRDLRNDGYSGFDRVIRDGRAYIVRGLDRRDRPVRIRVNARNGRVLSVNRARNYNGQVPSRHSVRGFDQWLPGLRQQHYTNFGQVTAHDAYYQVGARDRRGRNVTLNVCNRTGRVLHSVYR
jgi:uncharacterized membrane protein YkoI